MVPVDLTDTRGSVITAGLTRSRQASACIKLIHIDEYNKKRRLNAAIYNGLLSDAMRCPVEADGYYHVYHQYTVIEQQKGQDSAEVKRKRHIIGCILSVPLHLQEALRFLGYLRGDFPVAEKAAP